MASGSLRLFLVGSSLPHNESIQAWLAEKRPKLYFKQSGDGQADTVTGDRVCIGTLDDKRFDAYMKKEKLPNDMVIYVETPKDATKASDPFLEESKTYGHDFDCIISDTSVGVAAALVHAHVLSCLDKQTDVIKQDDVHRKPKRPRTAKTAVVNQHNDLVLFHQLASEHLSMYYKVGDCCENSLTSRKEFTLVCDYDKKPRSFSLVFQTGEDGTVAITTLTRDGMHNRSLSLNDESFLYLTYEAATWEPSTKESFDPPHGC